MLYGYNTIVINPLSPVRQAGFDCQTEPVFKVHDDLHARVLAFEDDKEVFINISADSLGFSQQFNKELTQKVQKLFDKPVRIIISATHSHYCGDSKVQHYYNQCLIQFYEAIQDLILEEGNLSVSYKTVEYTEVGTSRITNHKALVLLNLIQIYDDDKEVIDIINYNCHPTILDCNKTDFFSSEYVGYSLNKLNNESNIYHTFLQGAAGDVSTRFTRTTQDYNGVIALGDKFTAKVNQLKQEMATKVPFTSLNTEEKPIDITYDFSDLDSSLIPDNISERELFTIEQGKVIRKYLLDHKDQLQTYLSVTKVSFGNVNVIYTQNELFSYYLSILDTSKAFVVCYSNGYDGYVPPLNETLFTYEVFYDVLSKETKTNLAKAIVDFN